jgi:hypothetical protein
MSADCLGTVSTALFALKNYPTKLTMIYICLFVSATETSTGTFKCTLTHTHQTQTHIQKKLTAYTLCTH